MAIYVYKCERCKREFEVIRKMSEMDYEITCLCGKPMIRQVTNCSHHFRCLGFYHTDVVKGGKDPTN